MKVIITLLFCIATCTSTLAGNLQLANELMQEKQYQNAAIEFRRLALDAKQPPQQAAFFWGAAYAYYQQQNTDLAMKMLDLCDESENSIEDEITLLRLDCSIINKKTDSAGFYSDSLSTTTNNNLRRIAKLRQTKLLLINHDSQQALASIPDDAAPPIRIALENYAGGHDKNPKLGGMLGSIPGLGYAYSGEYANALRSIIMNGIFIYAMIETGDDGHWGVFSVLTFFEITWYTGSIYGGIDSAHRYNQRRLQACLQVIDSHSSYKPELHKLPALSIKYIF